MGSAVTALEALEALARQQPMGVSELARRLNISKPAAQRALRALADARWIQRSEQQPGRWVLTVKVLEIASEMGRELGLRDVAAPLMQELVDATGEATHLSVLDGHHVVTIDQVDTTQAVRIHWPIGSRSAAYAAASGKAILSALAEDLLPAHLPASLEPLTSQTITNLDDLSAELDQIRLCGYSVQRGEVRDDVASIAAPIAPRPAHPIAALSLFMPAHRFPSDGGAELGALVAKSAARISAAVALRR
jgi:IclR family transcriptional regulator, acetate operon repressor